MPYVLTFAALWLSGQIVWRIAIALIARVEIRGMEALYIEAMTSCWPRTCGSSRATIPAR